MSESGLQYLLGNHAGGSLLLLCLVWLACRCEAHITQWHQRRSTRRLPHNGAGGFSSLGNQVSTDLR